MFLIAHSYHVITMRHRAVINARMYMSRNKDSQDENCGVVQNLRHANHRHANGGLCRWRSFVHCSSTFTESAFYFCDQTYCGRRRTWKVVYRGIWISSTSSLMLSSGWSSSQGWGKCVGTPLHWLRRKKSWCLFSPTPMFQLQFYLQVDATLPITFQYSVLIVCYHNRGWTVFMFLLRSRTQEKYPGTRALWRSRSHAS